MQRSSSRNFKISTPRLVALVAVDVILLAAMDAWTRMDGNHPRHAKPSSRPYAKPLYPQLRVSLPSALLSLSWCLFIGFAITPARSLDATQSGRHFNTWRNIARWLGGRSAALTSDSSTLLQLHTRYIARRLARMWQFLFDLALFVIFVVLQQI